MTERRSPTLRRRRLSSELKRLREASGLTGTAVEKRLEWSPSKISRMESGDWKMPNVRDVKDLLDLYEVSDPGLRQELELLARDGRQKGWWQTYQDMLSAKYSLYIGLEAEARSISSYQNHIVPGLLQTVEYARALVSTSLFMPTAEEVEKRIEIRINRQGLLLGENPMELVAVLDEAAISRHVGGQEVWKGQIERLIQAAQMPNITLHLLPFEVDETAAPHGFTIMEFQDARDPKAAYVEMLAGEIFIEEEEEVRFYANAFERLRGSALSPAATVSALSSLI